MKRIIGMALLFLVLSITGCTLKLTFIDFEQESEKGGINYLRIDANGSTLSTETDQKADGKITIPLSSLTDPPSDLLEKVIIEKSAEKVIKTEVIQEPEIIQEEAIEDIKIESSGNYIFTEQHNLKAVDGNNKPFSWLDKTGKDYGNNLFFDFGECGTFLVADGTLTTGKNGNTGDHDQAFYFCGTDPEHQHGMNGRASIFGPPNCKAKTVTLSYNP